MINVSNNRHVTDVVGPGGEKVGEEGRKNEVGREGGEKAEGGEYAARYRRIRRESRDIYMCN